MIDNKEFIINLYNKFSSECKQYDYSLDIEKNEKKINSFFKHLYKKIPKHSVGKNLLLKFTFFQYDYYLDLDPSLYGKKRNYNFEWIYGKKSVERFFNRDINFDYKIGRFTSSILNINQTIFLDNADDDLFIYEEKIRKDFFGSNKGFFNCLAKEVYYNKKSKYCSSCLNSNKCLVYLRNTSPNLYRKRIN